MLFHEARQSGRMSDSGVLIPLEEQDRALWNRATIAEGSEILESALRLNRTGPYQIQAAIAACHATAPSPADTDWRQIALLYGRLYTVMPSAVVALNKAVAVGMAEGPEAGLALVEDLGSRSELADYHLLPATRADVLRRLGRNAEAATAYRTALDLARTDPEREFLANRLLSVLPKQAN